jgi:hypothetical protein
MRATPECPTILRLRGLRPGEVFTYYRGNITTDVAHSASAKGEPLYARLLERLRATAIEQEAIGRIRLSERKVKHLTRGGNEVDVTEYVAIGQ